MAAKTSDKESAMNREMLQEMAAELAKKVNKVINIPLIGEEDEEAFFELVIMLLLDIVLSKLGSKN